jgi:hypothetical protein
MWVGLSAFYLCRHEYCNGCVAHSSECGAERAERQAMLIVTDKLLL